MRIRINSSVAVLGLSLALTIPVLAKIPLDVSVPSKAKLGESVIVRVKTDPNAKCKIQVQGLGLDQTLKLLDQTADIKGKAAWTFEIPQTYQANEMPVTITVFANGQEDKSIGAIKIKR